MGVVGGDLYTVPCNMDLYVYRYDGTDLHNVVEQICVACDVSDLYNM